MRRKIAYFAALFLGVAQVSLAQEPVEKDTIEENEALNQQIVVQIRHRSDIATADKKDLEPKVLDSIPPIPKTSFGTLQKRMETEFSVDTINPAKLKSERIPTLDRIYLKGGFGTFTTTLLEARYHSLQSRKHSLGVDIDHLASSGQIDGRGPSGFSQNRALIYGRKFLKKHAIGGELEVDRNVVHYFGYDPGVVNQTIPELEEDDIRQRFLRVGGKATLKSFHKDSASINQDVELSYYHLGDQFNMNENNFKATAYLTRYFNQELFSLRAGVDYNTVTYAPQGDPVTRPTNNNLILQFHPGVVAKGERWRMNLGIAAFIDAGKDELAGNDETRFHFYPDLYVNYRVLGDVIIPYAGVTGNLKRANIRSLTDENPFLSTNTPLRNTNNKYKFYGGIRGAYSATTAFKLEASVTRVEDMPLFVNNNLSDPNYPSTVPLQLADLQFGVIYDTVDVINLSAEVSFQKTDRLNIMVRGDYFSYKPRFEFEAWHRPSYKLTTSAVYDLRDKIVVRADIFALSSQVARTNNPGR